MARRKEHDAQVDPFTAGEPTLPWDEPGVFDGLFDGIEPEQTVGGREAARTQDILCRYTHAHEARKLHRPRREEPRHREE